MWLDDIDTATFPRIESELQSICDASKNNYIIELLNPFESHLNNDEQTANFAAICSTLCHATLKISDIKSLVLNYQVHVFRRGTYNVLESFPREYVDSQRQIYLIGDISDNQSDIINIDIITNIVSFLNGTYFCFYCMKHFGSHGCQHMHKGVSCFSCRRPIAKTTTYFLYGWNEYPYT